MSTKPALFLGLLLSASVALGQQKGYYRTPAIYKNTVVFTAEGDLWKFDTGTGMAARLTTNDGVEQNPVISPDGRQIAFSGQYEGSSEVYIMDINGGVPKRLTYNMSNILLSGWTKDGKILYRTTINSMYPSPQLVKLDPKTLKSENIPLAQASIGNYDDNGNLYFTRFQNQGSKTKRYKGGFIEQIWKFDGKHEAVSLTADFDGTSTSPMFINGRIFFLSDRDGTMNLWSADLDGKNAKQQTFSKGWDLQTPSANGSTIVYQKGADIWTYDIATNAEKMLDIKLMSDFDQRKPKWIKSPVSSISFSDISPNGNYVAIVSRGRVFVSPAKSDRWVEVSRKSGIRVRDVHFLNSKSLAVLSDESGEFEIWQINADGSGVAKQITKGSKTQIASFAVSPNGRYIATNDKNDVIRIVDVANSEVKFKYDGSYGGTNDMSWSPNSTYLNISQSIENLNSQISVVDTRTMKMTPVTTTRLNSYSPAWSADNKWMFFVSERNLATKVSSPWGSRSPEPYYTQTANIYAMALDTAAKFPFLQTDSWLADSVFTTISHDGEPQTLKVDKTKPQVKPATAIDWAKAKESLYKVPGKSANIDGVAIANGYLYWLDRGVPGDDNGSKIYAMKLIESKKHEPTEIASFVSGFDVSSNGKKILVRFTNRNIAVIDADGTKLDLEKSKVELNNWTFAVEPQRDWQEMFDDAWRMMRDYFYDRDLHKVDWVAVREQYKPLVSRLTDRYELDDLLGQMVGEISALHTFVGGGDKRIAEDRIQTGVLGAKLEKVAAGYKIEHIYKADPDFDFSSPLDKPELRVREGDVITAINNVPLTDVEDMGELLANKVGIPVKLTLLDKGKKRYEQVVKPFSTRDAANLRYSEWELTRRMRVDSMSNDDIGYVHLRAMGGSDMDDFTKQFYPVFNRKGLILDVRGNNGGNIDSWILEKLMRKAWMYWQSRSGGPTWNMQYAFRGPMVILCDQQTASDGEAIVEGFRRLGLGKVIGMRTWGGEIWLSQDNRMVDNGIASAAEMGVFGPEGKWLIEGHGVDPDMVVDNLPFETYKGKDAQLAKAVDYLKTEIKSHPVDAPVVPKHPDKSFKYQ